MRTYKLHNNKVEIVINDGSIFTIYFNENSGKVYFRYKIGTISQVKHAGIFLGVDINGSGYFLHNHYHYGKAHITTQSEFVKGMPLYLYNEKCSNTPLKVIEIGLNEILRGESYKPISYNCQTYTNTACYNQRKSPDAEKWVDGLVLGSLVFLLFSAISDNK
ncbi:MAG: hypothetical protein IPJ26_07265 [Bacteroidetes bacterium]|nr:hypothetical protein [Bacteroidota bacterium]